MNILTSGRATVRRSSWWAVGLLALSASASATTYTYTDLGVLADNSDSGASGINDSGQVVGWSAASSGRATATLWSSTTAPAALLSTLGLSSRAYGINSAGQIAGESMNLGGFTHATYWSGAGAAATDLGTRPGTDLSGASSINASGQIAGGTYSRTSSGPPDHATLWNGSTVTDLGTLGGSTSSANGINNAGKVVGWATTSTGATHATVWDTRTSTMTDLGTLGGVSSFARGANNAGWVVGSSYFSMSSSEQHATLWDGGTMTDLGVTGTSSAAVAVNDAGDIVGQAGGSPASLDHAMLWRHGSSVDLNTYLDARAAQAGWLLATAEGINADGSIVGSAYNTLTGQSHAYILTAAPATPVPETSSSAMLLAGLGVLGFLMRRRRI